MGFNSKMFLEEHFLSSALPCGPGGALHEVLLEAHIHVTLGIWKAGALHKATASVNARGFRVLVQSLPASTSPSATDLGGSGVSLLLLLTHHFSFSQHSLGNTCWLTREEWKLNGDMRPSSEAKTTDGVNLRFGVRTLALEGPTRSSRPCALRLVEGGQAVGCQGRQGHTAPGTPALLISLYRLLPELSLIDVQEDSTSFDPSTSAG